MIFFKGSLLLFFIVYSNVLIADETVALARVLTSLFSGIKEVKPAEI